MFQTNTVLSEYSEYRLLLLSNNTNAIVSANDELLSVEITCFLRSGEMLAWPKGGGLGNVIICSNELASKHRMIPSAQPQANRFPLVYNAYPPPACKSIHLSMTLSKVNTHKTPSCVRAKIFPAFTATLEKFLSFISARSKFLLIMHLISAFPDAAVVIGRLLRSKDQILMDFIPPVTKKSPAGAKAIDRIRLVILFDVSLVSFLQSQTKSPPSCSLPTETKQLPSGEKTTDSTPYLWPFKVLIGVICF